MPDARLKRHSLGFWQVADMPSEEALKEYYSDLYFQDQHGGYRKTYSESEIAYFDLKTAQYAAVVEALRPGLGPGTYLDVGCGEGFALAWFQARGWICEGIDYSSAGVEAVNPDFMSSLEVGDVFQLLERRISQGRSFDLVWLKHVLEHVIDPVGLLQSLRRLVSKDGVLVVVVPNDGTPHQEQLVADGDIADRSWIAIPDHLSYFDFVSLERIAEASGWRCADHLSDFPIDLFLLHPSSNYVADRSRGPAAHQARIRHELLLGKQPHALVNDYYRCMARLGLGRSQVAFLTPN